QRITYRVIGQERSHSDSTDWRVQEIAREAWVAEPAPVEPVAPPLERIALELLGEIHLDFAALEPAPGSNHPPIGRIRHRAVDLQGRIYVTDGAASAVYAFGPSGEALCVGRPLATDFEEPTGFAWISATSTGRIALGTSRPPRLVEFDPSC